ncbi:MAG: hypothetical protein H7145_18865 [Akkermansiaceae bacterium]|nr:hypothetical protein [Armatimonadota bacterium]
MRRPKPWWHDHINLIVAHRLIQASREFFRSHVALAPLAPPKRKPILHRLYARVEEGYRERAQMQEFERERGRQENFARMREEHHRRWLKESGLPEDASHQDVLDHIENRRREAEIRAADSASERAASEAERNVLKRLLVGTEDDPTKEIAALREYCAAHPDSELGGSFLIGGLRKAKRFDEAIRLARQQVERAEQRESVVSESSPTFAKRNPWRTLILKQSVGVILLEKGDTQEGIRHLERSIAEQEQESKDVLRDIFLSCAYLQLGDAYREAGAIPEARNAWKQALRLQQSDDDGYTMNDRYVINTFGGYDSTKEIVKRLRETPEQS